MFYRNWYERGIRFVNDLFDENGSLLSYESVIQMFDLRTNFLDLRSVITTIRRFLTVSNLNVAQCKLNVPCLPFTLIEVLKNKKRCRDMYDILVTNTDHSPANNLIFFIFIRFPAILLVKTIYSYLHEFCARGTLHSDFQ